MTNAKYGIWITDSLMYDLGLKNGDKILSVDGKPVEYFNDLPSKIILGTQITL